MGQGSVTQASGAVTPNSIRMGPSQAPQCLDNQFHVGFKHECGPQLSTKSILFSPPSQNRAGCMQVRTLAGQEDGAGETGAGRLEEREHKAKRVWVDSGWSRAELDGLGRSVLGWSCWVQAESWGRREVNGQGLGPGVGKPHLMIILVPHSDFCGCLCLEVCLHLGKTEYYRPMAQRSASHLRNPNA